MKTLDVAIVGGGQAGLGVGFVLQEAGLDVAIFERGRVAETWRTQRWDSFAVNTPNWANGLPGFPYRGDRPDGFFHRDELIAHFEEYVVECGLPVRERTNVTAIEANGDSFVVRLEEEDGGGYEVDARNVVIASGMMQAPKIPPISERFPDSIVQLHAAHYRSPDALPPGAVVVIGSGQSGCQIAEDLLHGGREVYMCTSKVARVRRRYRGRDALEWMEDMGLFDQTVEDLPDPAMQFAAQAQVSGLGRYGSTLSLQSMAAEGLRLMGRLEDVRGGVLATDDSLADHVAFADEESVAFARMVDEWIVENGVDAASVEDDANDAPAGPEVADAGLTELDLAAAGVTSVVWCTGFTAHFEYVHLAVTDEHGRPVHQRGISEVDGLYFIGFPWLHTRKSGIIHGVEEDARFLAEAILARG